MSDLGLTFSQPLALLGLLALPLYAVVRYRALRRAALPFAPLQYSTRRSRDRLPARLRVPAEIALLSVAIVGLAGLHRSTTLDLFEDEGVDVALVLDVSLSMLAEDFPPTRLAALQRIAGDFVKRSGSHRVGTVIFAKDCYVQAPLTTDHRALLELMAGVSVLAIDQAKSGGTAVGDALLLAVEMLRKQKIEGRDQALVLITDGASNEGSDPLLAARFARHHGVRLYAIGVGGEEPMEVYFNGRRLGGDDPYLAVLDEAQLRAVVAAADGRFYRATDVGALERIFAELSRLESAPIEARQVEIRRFFTDRLALVALLLFGVCLTLGGVAARRPLR